jgi:hypothetical protein
MKATTQPTANILIRAYTNSDWDECQFAIIHCDKEWKETMKNRVECVQPFSNDYNFCCLKYYDTSVDFYRTDEEDIEELLQDKEWVFVELNEDEQETFLVPENGLDTYSISIYRTGTAKFSACGKHTGEDFWTEEFNLKSIMC